MRIGVDIDGTALAHPEFFSELMSALRQRGHEVGFVTGRPTWMREQTFQELQELGFPRPDFYVDRPAAELMIPAPQWKPVAMRLYDVDFLFDNLDTREIRLLTRRTRR